MGWRGVGHNSSYDAAPIAPVAAIGNCPVRSVTCLSGLPVRAYLQTTLAPPPLPSALGVDFAQNPSSPVLAPSMTAFALLSQGQT